MSLPRRGWALRGKTPSRVSRYEYAKRLARDDGFSPPALSLAEHGADRGVRRRPAEIVGEGAAGVGDDPHVQHLPGVLVPPGRRVAGAAQLDAEPGDRRLAVLAHRQVRVTAGQPT